MRGFSTELQVSTNDFPLPAGLHYEIVTQRIKRDKEATEATARKGNLLKTKGLLLEPGETVQIPIKITLDGSFNGNQPFTLKGDIIPLVAGKRK